MKLQNYVLGMSNFKELEDSTILKLCTKCKQYKPMTTEFFNTRKSVKCGSGKLILNASIDRIEPGKDYSLNNVRLVCTYVNMMRSNLSDEELLEFCRNILINNKIL